MDETGDDFRAGGGIVEDVGGAEEDAAFVVVEFEVADGEFLVGAHEHLCDDPGAADWDGVPCGGDDADGVDFCEDLSVDAGVAVMDFEIGFEDLAAGDAAGLPAHAGEGVFDGAEERGDSSCSGGHCWDGSRGSEVGNDQKPGVGGRTGESTGRCLRSPAEVLRDCSARWLLRRLLFSETAWTMRCLPQGPSGRFPASVLLLPEREPSIGYGKPDDFPASSVSLFKF